MFPVENLIADCEPARMQIKEWLSSQKRVSLTSSSTGITIFFREQQPGSIAVQMMHDAGQGGSLSSQGS
jgi:hypothetical protein